MVWVRVMLLGCSFRGGWLGGRGFVANFVENLDLHVRGDFAVQLDGHTELAQAPERLVQLDLAAINLKALGLKCRWRYRPR